MIRGFIRLIFYAVIVYFVWLAVRIWRAATRPRKAPDPPREIRGEMVKDEICNTYIPKEAALREMHQGEEHFFCSEECRGKFRAALRSR